MIPEFPEFKKLELSDRDEIESFTIPRLPYSDFNFTSLWCWDTWGKTRISILDGNLVLKVGDYLTDSNFLSFMGENRVEDTADKLLEFAKHERIPQVLKFIPEESVKKLDLQRFRIEQDIDQFDYILDNEKLVDYKGSALHNHAGFKRRFTELHSERLKLEILDFEHHQHHINLLNELWAKNRIVQNKDIVPELEDKAIRNIFDLAKGNELYCSVALFLDDKLIAFTIDELLPNEYSVRHFMKGDTNYKGVYSFLVSESARQLLKKGKRYTNIEQDLGLPGLRQAKRSYAPAAILKKYTISYLYT